ncbi:MAG: hypothetical protein ACOC2J_05065, partial [bacterium]
MNELTPALTCHLLNAGMVISTTAYDELPHDEYINPITATMQYINILKKLKSDEIVDKYSDVVIEHDVGDYSFMDFQLADKFIDIGYSQTRLMIPEIKRIMIEKGIPTRKREATYTQRNHLQQVIKDIENERTVWDFTTINPGFYFGKNHSFTVNNLFRQELREIQYELEVDHKNIKINAYTSGNELNNYQVKALIKKLNKNIDLEFLHSNNKFENQSLYRGSLLYYPDYTYDNKPRDFFQYRPEVNELAYQILDDENSIYFKQNYSASIRQNQLYGYLKTIYNIDDDNKFDLIFANKSVSNLNQDWQLSTKMVYSSSNNLNQPVIYRGNNFNLINNLSSDNNLQISLETNYRHTFEYSLELLQAIQLSYLDFYQFIDFDTDNDISEADYACGTGLRTNLYFAGIKPFAIGSYLVYDFAEK